MAIRPIGVSRPPATEDPALERYLQELRAAIQGLPFSVFSTSDGPNVSGVTAPVGFIGIEIGSSATKHWLKQASSNTTGWRAISVL